MYTYIADLFSRVSYRGCPASSIVCEHGSLAIEPHSQIQICHCTVQLELCVCVCVCACVRVRVKGDTVITYKLHESTATLHTLCHKDRDRVKYIDTVANIVEHRLVTKLLLHLILVCYE